MSLIFGFVSPRGINICLSLSAGIQIGESAKIKIAAVDNFTPRQKRKKTVQGTCPRKQILQRRSSWKKKSCNLKKSPISSGLHDTLDTVFLLNYVYRIGDVFIRSGNFRKTWARFCICQVLRMHIWGDKNNWVRRKSFWLWMDVISWGLCFFLRLKTPRGAFSVMLWSANQYLHD